MFECSEGLASQSAHGEFVRRADIGPSNEAAPLGTGASTAVCVEVVELYNRDRALGFLTAPSILLDLFEQNLKVLK